MIRRSNSLAALTGAAVLAICLLFPETTLGKALEQRLSDSLFALRGTRTSAAKVAVIAIDDETQRRWKEPMVFWGGHLAATLRGVEKAGAIAIGMDLVPTVDADTYLETLSVEKDLRPDSELGLALDDAKVPIHLGYVLDPDHRPILPNERFLSIPDVEDRIGFLNRDVDRNAVVRSLPLSAASEEDRRQSIVRPSLAATVAASVVGVSPFSPRGVASLARERVVDREDYLHFRPNFLGRTLPTVPAWRVETGQLRPEDREALRGAATLLGTDYRGSANLHETPVGPMSDLQLQANALATLLDGRALLSLDVGSCAFIALVLGIVSLALGTRQSFWRGILASGVMMLAYFLVARNLFVKQDLLLPLVAPLLATFLPYLTQQSVVAVEEERLRQSTDAAFGAFVSPEVRDHVLAAGGIGALEPVTDEVSVLFFDMRGTLAFTERREAKDVMADLNELFSAVLPAIANHGGTLSRFTGDGFLALFGTPKPLADHAAAAVAAAQEIVKCAAEKNRERAAQKKRLLPEIGCSVNTGTVVSGCLGSATRSDFTVIGDPVNRAARLEGMNKTLRSRIVLSAETIAYLPEKSPPPGFLGPVTHPVEGSQHDATVYYLPLERLS